MTIPSAQFAYVNGTFVDRDKASISIFDRGFLFADGVYEVTAVLKGQLIDFIPHMARLERSCSELGLPLPWSQDELQDIHRQLLDRNGLQEGLVYLQLTRGADDVRAFQFPSATKPSLVMFTQSANLYQDPKAEVGVALASFDDIRWARRDIKSVALLAQVLAKQAAHEQGAYEACMIEDGVVTEGGSSSIAFFKADGTLVMRPFSNAVLPSITRLAATELAQHQNIKIEERSFTLDELLAADEVFIASATAFIMPVTQIDGKRIGGGQPGPKVRRLRELYFAAAELQIADALHVAS